MCELFTMCEPPHHPTHVSWPHPAKEETEAICLRFRRQRDGIAWPVMASLDFLSPVHWPSRFQAERQGIAMVGNFHGGKSRSVESHCSAWDA